MNTLRCYALQCLTNFVLDYLHFMLVDLFEINHNVSMTLRRVRTQIFL